MSETSNDEFAELLDGLVPGPTLQWTIGGVEVTRVGEWIVPTPREMMVPDITDRQLVDNSGWLEPYVVRDLLLLSFHAFVVKSEGCTIVVDTCLGDAPVRMVPGNPEFLDRLAAEVDGGLDAVDVVLCTHLHFDHVGWNTRLIGGERFPTFGNARYLFGRAEIDHLASEEDDMAIEELDIRPVIDAGLADLIDTRHTITSEVRTVPTIGHTPGHVSVLIESQGERALITGDVFHTPLQIRHPELPALFDWDVEQSTTTRRDVVEQYADSDTLVLGTHFAPPTAGHIRRGDDGVWFESWGT
jgi:glyoxylase-like metal-dependent hydrolase (beta-lactamase superfamily II)